MTQEERREWHKNHRVDEYTKRKNYIEYCIKNKIVYKSNYELVTGKEFRDKQNRKADVLKLPRHNGGNINGKKML